MFSFWVAAPNGTMKCHIGHGVVSLGVLCVLCPPSPLEASGGHQEESSGNVKTQEALEEALRKPRGSQRNYARFHRSQTKTDR